MSVSFLDLVPAPPAATVRVNSAQGHVELELTGVSLRVLADIAKRFPAFVRRLEGGAGSLMEQPDAMSALVAAALGHANEAPWERQIASFPTADVMVLFQAALQLTFPQADPVPLPPSAAALVEDALRPAAAAVANGSDRTSRLPSSN